MNLLEILKNKKPLATSIYLTILMIYVFHLNLNARYSVSLVVKESEREIDSLEQLALRKEITLIGQKGTSKEEYFKVSLIALNCNYLKRKKLS